MVRGMLQHERRLLKSLGRMLSAAVRSIPYRKVKKLVRSKSFVSRLPLYEIK